MNDSIQPYEQFVHVPAPAEPPLARPQPSGELGTEFAAPQTDCFVADDKAWRPQSLARRWSVYVAERESARRTKWNHPANRLLQRGDHIVPGTTMRSEAVTQMFSSAHEVNWRL